MIKTKNFFKKIGNSFYNEFVGTWKGISKETIPFPILLLVIFNVVCLLISNIVAVKTFSFGAIETKIGNLSFGIPAAILIYMMVIMISDILCEVDPTSKWTRRSCHLGFGLNLFMVAVFEISIAIQKGNPDTLSVLGSTWFMLIASVTSFYLGDLLNDKVFKRFKNKDGQGKKSKLIKRCMLSTLCGQLVDATIFVTLGLQVLPGLVLGFTFTGGSSLSDPIGWANTGLMIGMQLVVKLLCELVAFPLVNLICTKMNKKEAK